MPLDNAFRGEGQANGGRQDAGSGGPGVSFMPKLGSTALAEPRKQALSAEHQENLHVVGVGTMAIDEPIALPEDFPDDGITKLGDDAARLRKLGEAADGLKKTTHNERGVVR
jgi:hypothetical protein